MDEADLAQQQVREVEARLKAERERADNLHSIEADRIASLEAQMHRCSR